MVMPYLVLAVATSTAVMEHSNLVTTSHDSTVALRVLPKTLGLSSLFEQVAGPAVVLVEESGGFGDVDPEKIGIYGDSWTWTRWYVDGFDVSDPVFDGAAGFHVPYPSMQTVSIQFDENPLTPRRQGIAIATREVETAGAMVTLGGVGGRMFLATAIMDAFSGKHAVDREPPPPEERRRHAPTLDLYLAETAALPNGRLAVAAQARIGERRFLSFDWDGSLREVVPENTAKASLLARYRPDHGKWSALLLGEVVSRDRLFAEVGFDPRETSQLDKQALLAGIAGEGWRVGLTFARYGLTARDRLFARDVIDPDGEALFPFEPDGTTWVAKSDVSFESGPFYGWAVDRALVFSTARRAWTQPATYQGESYGMWELFSGDTTTFLGDHRVGVRGVEEGPVELAYDLFGSAVTNANEGGGGLTFLDVGLRASATFPSIGPVTPFFTLAKTPMPIPVGVARQLDPSYLSASLVRNDGGTDDTFGGGLIRVDDNLVGPNVYRAALGIDIAISDHVRFGAQGIFKMFRGMLRLSLDGDAQQYGDFVGDAFYWNDRPRAYVLENEDADLPAYWGLHLDLTTRDLEDLFFSASFSAYNAIGETTFGSGALSNDVGVISHAGASPNARRLGLASLDVDRAFMLKVAVAWRIVDELWFSATVRHRDGQPFAFLDTNENDGQVALTYHSNRGSPLKYTRPLAGPREDFFLNADVQLAYRIGDVSVWLLAANLLDMENEIREVNGPPGIDGRAALETQLPRSILFGVSVGQ